MRVISSCWLRPCPLYTPPVAPTDWVIRWIIRTAVVFSSWILLWKVWWTLSLRGRRSRNKVSVGEPAEGSFAHVQHILLIFMWNLHGDIMLIPLSNTIWHCVTHDSKHSCSFPLPQYVEQTLTLILPAALYMKSSQFSATDVSVWTPMKGAAKCDKHCELQNSVSRQGLEHILYFWDILKSMSTSVSPLHCFNNYLCWQGALL